MRAKRVAEGMILAGALLLTALSTSSYARFTVGTVADYPGERRHLCYTLDASVAADPLWVSWIDNAANNWNGANTGWTLRKCTSEDKIPDVRFTFGTSSAGAQGSFQSTGTENYQIIIQQDVTGLTINGKTITNGGDKGWRLEDGSGQTLLDPILVMGHELSHALRLDHIPGQCNTGDLEEPICPGNHGSPAGRKPSAGDIVEATKSFNDRTAANAAAEAAGVKKNETTPMFGGLESSGLKASDNESPQPTDRVFFNYSYFTDGSYHLNRETVGFEKTFLDGQASIGMRLPFFQSPYDSDNGDLTIIAKYAFANANPLITGGLAVSLPTEPSSGSPIFQPFIGWQADLGNTFFLQGFHSVALPTESGEHRLLFNDAAMGFWLFRGAPGNTIMGAIPTLGVHFDTDLDATSNGTATDLTFGVHFPLIGGGTPGIGLSLPVAGPKVWDSEVIANFDFRW